MRVRLITNYAGPRGAWSAETVLDFPAAEADELILAKSAEPVDADGRPTDYKPKAKKADA